MSGSSPLSDLLVKITSASRALNRAADAAADQIERVEKALLDAEPGVSVWDAVILEEETLLQPEDAATAQDVLRRVTLGFAKVKSKWGIAVRDEMLAKKRVRDTQFSESVTCSVSLLRKSDRDLRLLAVDHLESLLGAILATLEARSSRVLVTADDAALSVDADRSSARPTMQISSKPIETVAAV